MDNVDDSKSPYAGLAKKIRGGKSASTIEYESRKPTIRITRLVAKSGFGKAFKLLDLYEKFTASNGVVVLVNQTQMAVLAPGESVKVEVEPGDTTIRVKSFAVSAVAKVNLEMGQRVNYICFSSMTGIVLTQKKNL